MQDWDRARLALALLDIDPIGLGGIVVKGRAGPARDAFLRFLPKLDPDFLKLHPAMGPDALDGTIDIATTLETGKIVQHRGLLSRRDRLFCLSMAERTMPYLAARLAIALDAGDLRGLIALDEGADPDETLPSSFSDRIAFQVSLDDIALADIIDTNDSKKAYIGAVDVPDDLPEQLVILASQLGINSLRAPLFALRAAKAHAALMGRASVMTEDIIQAVALTYAHRATQLPQTDDPVPPTPEQPDAPPPESAESEQLSLPDDLLLDAVLSALPKGLLDQLKMAPAKSGAGAGSGGRVTGNRRGRPLPPRDVTARSQTRIDLMATLRAAIPWQTLRKANQPGRSGPIIHPADLRAKRYQNLSDRVLIFAVDASGSAALARLGEAKGAIEILLGEAYSRRDHVALIAFRGTEAEVLLPPTRSLVQTKRRLASLPGGGGTPLAAGLLAAVSMAESARKRGQTPTVIVLTDGRSNIALDGSANRVLAASDATYAAQTLRMRGIDAIMIDTGVRPDTSLRTLANVMAAHYIALPRADARRLSGVIATSLGD